MATSHLNLLTEREYRIYSKDTTSPWSTTGANVADVLDCIELAAEDIGRYLATSLWPKAAVEEQHRVIPSVVYQTGKVIQCMNRVVLNKKRLLDRSTIVRTRHLNRVTCVETIKTGCLTIQNNLASIVDLTECASGSCGCSLQTTNNLIMLALVSYWYGFESIEVDLKRTVAMLARQYAKELIVGDWSMDTELMYGAPMLKRETLGIRRWFAEPERTPFGTSFLGQEIVDRLAPYIVTVPYSM